MENEKETILIEDNEEIKRIIEKEIKNKKIYMHGVILL